MKHATLSHTNLSKKRAKKELRRKRVLRSRKALERDLLFQFRLTIKHFFPKIDKWLKRIDDPRQKKKTDYGIRELMWMGLLILCTPTESLNKYEEDYFFEESVTNLKKVFNLQIDRIQRWGMKFPNALVRLCEKSIFRQIKDEFMRLFGQFFSQFHSFHTVCRARAQRSGARHRNRKLRYIRENSIASRSTSRSTSTKLALIDMNN